MNRYLLLVIGLMIPLSVLGKVNFVVAPGFLEIDLNKPKTKRFFIENTGDEKIRIRVSSIFFKVGGKSFPVGTYLFPDKTPISEDLSNFIKFSPKVFSIAPNKKKYVRLALKKNKNWTEGDYRIHLLVRLAKSSKGNIQEAKGPGGMAINIEMKLETAVAIYGRLGTPNTQLSWKCSQKDGIFSVEANNPSPWRYNGFLGLYEANQNEHLILKKLIVHRETKRAYKFQLPQKSYVLRWGPLSTIPNDLSPDQIKNSLNSGEVKCAL